MYLETVLNIHNECMDLETLQIPSQHENSKRIQCEVLSTQFGIPWSSLCNENTSMIEAMRRPLCRPASKRINHEFHVKNYIKQITDSFI